MTIEDIISVIGEYDQDLNEESFLLGLAFMLLVTGKFIGHADEGTRKVYETIVKHIENNPILKNRCNNSYLTLRNQPC